MELSQEEFGCISRYIQDLCGVVIRENKKYLISQRLEPLVISEGCTSFKQFYEILNRNISVRLQEQVINAITTRETSFFRDNHPFRAFSKTIIPLLGDWIRERKFRPNPRKGPKVRIWSAGISTGQEPYSIAILIREYAEKNRYLGIDPEDFGIIATDISSTALARAMSGRYSEIEVERGLISEYREKYFRKHEGQWRIDESIRSMIEFRQINLAKPFIMLGGFDVIFCRNVLIYFKEETKSAILDQFAQLLCEKGYLILGSTENVYCLSTRFQSMDCDGSMVYRKVPDLSF